MRTHVLALVAAAAMAAPVPASAATVIYGTLAASIVRVRSTTRVIGVDSVFTNRSASANDTTGWFYPVLDGPLGITLDPITATVGTGIKFVGAAFGSYVGTVDTVDVTPAGGGRTLTIVSLGTFTPTGSLNAYLPGPASVIFSFTQAGSGSAISGSFTLKSPPPGVPEPLSWALLLTGSGMAGAALRRRKKAVPVIA